MPRYPKDINAIYISERMQENLRHIKECTMTSIVAPMGYGKTTAALWYMEERQRKGDLIFRVNIYSSDVNLFWQSFCNAFKETQLGNNLQGMDFPASQTAVNMLIQDMADYLNTIETDLFLLIDDCHLMDDNRVFSMLFSLCDIPTTKLHMIVISRSVVFMHGEELHLGKKLYKITADDMRFNRTELSAYLRRCGIDLSENDFEILFQNSEGWISCIYLNIRNFEKSGALLSKGEDIYTMIGDTLYASYGKSEQQFILYMCIADEFTVAQAEFITSEKDAKEIIKSLARNNAFICYLPDTDTYRFHHMLRDYSKQLFDKLSDEKQKSINFKYGQWHENKGQYIQAFYFYREADSLSKILHAIGLDRGVQLASMDEDVFLSLLEKCTKEDLMNEPLVLLVLMRQLFSRKQIPKMFELKSIFMEAVNNPVFSQEERNNLLGECDLIMSFLGYNDISAMSALHQKAATLMTRKAISTGNTGSYTFGSPSVLMMFHRECGKLAQEVDTLNRSMPYYYQITDQSGVGAELIMEAEALYHKGEFTDAKIMLKRAKEVSQSTNQLYLPLCCEFLEQRLSLFGEIEKNENWYKQKTTQYMKATDPMIFNTLDACYAYISSVSKKPENIPDWIAKGKIAQANLLNPARPMFELIYNQTLLANKDYIGVLAREEQLLRMCRAFPYLLCEIHLHIQLAIANSHLSKKKEATAELKQALELSLPDGILMPFAENGQKLCDLLDEFEHLPETEKIRNLIKKLSIQLTPEENKTEILSKREKTIALLHISGKTRKEIADELFLSEGTVKNYISTVYDKLNLIGTPKQKQHALSVILSNK